MTIRRDPIYLSNDVWRTLHLLCKSVNTPDSPKKLTPDEIADDWLRDVINKKYPQFADHQSKVLTMEKELIASLSKKEKP